MISSLAVNNFKSFNKGSGHIKLGSFNIFCGKNSSGKSTFIQPLMLMSQSVRMNSNTNSIHLNGKLLSLGRFSNLISTDTSDDSFSFGFAVANPDSQFISNIVFEFYQELSSLSPENESEVTLKKISISGTTKAGTHIGPHEIIFSINSKAQIEAVFPKEMTKSGTQNILKEKVLLNFIPDLDRDNFTEELIDFFDDIRTSLSINNLNYLSASRLGPQIAQIGYINSVLDLDPTGSNSYTLSELYFGKKSYPELAVPNGKSGLVYEHQVSEWMSYIFDTDLEFKNPEQLTHFAVYDNQHSSMNVGFGLSYALHIVLVCLAPVKRAQIVIENPEAHLEPGALFKLIDLLERVSKNGTQVIIETHSDIVVNAIRLKVKENSGDGDHYKLFFVEKDKGSSSIREIKLNVNAIWPKGFLDKNEEILRKLYGV